MDQQDKITQAADALSEHFDSVLILVTYQENGVTEHCFMGRGNVYAQIGSADEWLVTQREYAKMQSRNTNETD